MKRIDLPMTQSEAMILWGVLDKLAAPCGERVRVGVEIDLDDRTELSWVRDRLATLCMVAGSAPQDPGITAANRAFARSHKVED